MRIKTQFHGKHGRHAWYIGIGRRFQWIGFMISTDNAITYHDYFLIELRFLWLRMWYSYQLTESALGSINVMELERQIESALEKETKETLTLWLEHRRQKAKI